MRKRFVALTIAAALCFLSLPLFATGAMANTYTYDISQGNITISAGTNSGTIKVSYGGGLVDDNILSTQQITITGSSTPASGSFHTNSVTVSPNLNDFTVYITLDNVSIENSYSPPLSVGNYSTVHLTLIGINTLDGTSWINAGDGSAGLEVPYYATLVISADSTGSLTATGGANGAGIGSSNGPSGMVTINGGTVTANGGYYGAGIGGGNNGTGTVTINGGKVTARGMGGGAGIGGGSWGFGTVTINGGTVTATGDRGAGIGGGESRSGTVTINGGSVKASPTPSTVTNSSSSPEYLVTISGLPVSVGLSYEVNGGIPVSCSTDNNGKLYLWLCATTGSAADTILISAGGSQYAASGAISTGTNNFTAYFPLNTTPTAAPGTVQGTTTITASPNTGGDELRYLVSTSFITAPVMNSTSVPEGAVTSGSNLAAAAGDWVVVYELNGSSQVVAFSEIQLSAGDIAAVAPTITTQPANATVNIGATATFTVAASAPDGGTLTYQWQSSTDGGTTWVNVSGGTGAATASYTTGTLAYSDNGTGFKCVVTNSKNGTTATATSNAATLTMNPPAVTPTITTQPANATRNIGATAAFTVAASSSDGGTLTYQWQLSTNGGANWGNVSGGTGAATASYTTGTLAYSDNGTGFRCVVTNSKNGTTATATSNAANLTMNPPAVTPTITTQPANATEDTGATAAFTVAASASDGGTLTYQWQSSTDGGTTWGNVSGGTGAATASYTTGTLAYSDNGTGFQCVVTNSKNGTTATATSNAATLTVNPPPVVTPTITTQPANATGNIGATATFTVAASAPDGGTLTYQWQSSTDGGATWGNVSGGTGAATASYTTGTLATLDSGSQYRCVVTNSKYGTTATATSNAATLTVNPLAVTPTITTQPANATGNIGATATFTVAASASDGGTLTYQWQSSTDGGATWGNVSGGTGAATASYTTGTLAASDSGSQYRCVVTNSKNGTSATATSNAATLTMNPPAVTPTITTQPANATENIGATATFTVAASAPDGGTLTYQWQSSTDGGANWGNVSGGTGATTASYTTGTLAASDSGSQYMCVVTNNLNGTTATTNSSAATLTVLPLTITTTSLPDGTVGASYNSGSLSATSGVLPYTWSAGGLPTGLNINTVTGVVYGTPITSGTFPVQLTVTDSVYASSSVDLNLVINPVPVSLTIITSSLPDGIAGVSYNSGPLSAAGGVPPYTWSASGLPNGLNINTVTGALSGTPTTSGTSSAQISVTDSVYASNSQNFSLIVYPVPSVTQITPSNGPTTGGTSVNITGTGLSTVSAVYFGNNAATNFTLGTDNLMSAVSPAGTGTVNVTVYGPGGTSATNPSDRFTYNNIMSYTVSFDSQGGSNVTSLTVINSGSTISEPTAPTKDGYTFGGWYKEPTYINAWNFSIDTVNSDKTLYARWTAAVSSGGRSGSATPQPAGSTTGSATVTPAAGGSVSIGSDVTLKIPANALQGSADAQVAVQKTDSPPPAPSGFMVVGASYQFTVNGQDHCNFDKPVTLTFTFDPSKVAPGETPAVYYYDETKGQWVNIGGTVSGNTITVTVDHFTEFAVMAAEKVAQPQEQEPSAPLTDISGHWAEKNIEELVSQGAITGYPDGTFKPDSTITRAEFATVLVKAFQLAPQEGRVFADIANHWASDYISTAAACGVLNGYDENTFGPDDPVTREQMVVMAVKAAKLLLADEQLTFKDSADISAWAEEAVATVAKGGIMGGYPDNTFRPGGNATRAEAVTVIVKALNK